MSFGLLQYVVYWNNSVFVKSRVGYFFGTKDVINVLIDFSNKPKKLIESFIRYGMGH